MSAIPESDEPCRRALNALLREFLGTAATLQPGRLDCEPGALAELTVRLGLVRPVYRALSRSLCSDVGMGLSTGERAALKEALRPALARHITVAMKVDADSMDVVRALGEAGVPHVPFKGSFLARDLYGDPEFRAVTDVDIILPGGPRDLPRAYEALGSLGYELGGLPRETIDYLEDEKGQITLKAPGRLDVDLHCIVYSDLPARVFREAASRAIAIQDEDPPRLRLAFQDLFVILAVHYWGQEPPTSLRWLLDCAVLARSPETFPEGWPERIRSWRAGFIVAATLAAAMHEFGLEPASGAWKEARANLSARMRGVIRRVLVKGPGSLPFGLAKKVHRMGLPLRENLEAVRRFFWPHPGKLIAESPSRRAVAKAAMAHRRPGILSRARYAARKLTQALRAR